MTLTPEQQNRAYLQTRQNPLLNSFSARSVLKQRAKKPRVIKEVIASDDKPNKPKKPKVPRAPSAIPTQAVTPFVHKARSALEQMMADLQAHEAILASMSPEELERAVAAERQKEQAEAQQSSQLEDIIRTQPDYVHWARFQSWTGEEFVALLLDTDPRAITLEAIKPFADKHDFAREFMQQYELVSRSFDIKKMYSPLMFASWARRIELGLPNALKSCIEKHKFSYDAPAETKPFVGSLSQRLDAQAYTWLVESDPKRFKNKFKEAAMFLANQRNEQRDDLAILTSMRRGLGISKQK